MLDANPKWQVQFKKCLLHMFAEITGTGRAKAKTGFAGDNTTSKSGLEKTKPSCLGFKLLLGVSFGGPFPLVPGLVSTQNTLVKFVAGVVSRRTIFIYSSPAISQGQPGLFLPGLSDLINSFKIATP